MNSSGIKRGLAVSAVSALAVAGIPALANTAQATPGDSFTVTYTGPVLNGGTHGGVVTLRALDGTINPADLELTSTTSATAGSEDTADQTVDIVGTPTVTQDSTAAAYEFIQVNIAVTTPAAGDTATFRIYEDDNNPGTDGQLDASEARQTVTLTTSGPLADIVVSPTSQSSPAGIESGAYTVTLKDAAGRTTQLDSGEQVNVTPDATVTVSDATLDATDLERGTDTFTATGSTEGTYDIDLASTTTPVVTETAQLVVTKSASLTADEIDIVTAADTWDGFDGGIDGGVTLVRVDQNTIRIDINGGTSDANGNVLLTVDGTGVTFGGQDKANYTTTLDANGDGSITIAVDAATIQDGDTFALSANGFDQTIEFDRSHVASVDGESDTYFCKLDSACTVTAVVADQFGLPITTGEVKATLTGVNDTTSQRKAVGSDGTVDFTFTDAKAANGNTDTVSFEYFDDSFDNDSSDDPTGSTTIKWTTTGQGSDYVISIDSASTEAAGYKASDHDVIPLFDTVVNGVGVLDTEDEAADISIAGGENNQAVTLSVDNGARILAPGEDELSEGSESVQATFDGAGTLSGYRIIGTDSGLVTLTVESAGRTETAQILVKDQTNTDSARNVTVSGPATVPHGTTQIAYTAVVTDAFGNPVPGVNRGWFNIMVSGPAVFQDGTLETNSNGELTLNVKVDGGAAGDVTLTLTAQDGSQISDGPQFGAAEDRQFADSTTDDGKDLSVSMNEASATTTVEAAPVPPEKVNAALALKGGDNGAADDSLFANAINKTEGAKVKLFRKRADGTWKWLQTGVMNSKGNYRFDDVRDFNGDKVTRYKAVVKATALTNRGVGKKKVR